MPELLKILWIDDAQPRSGIDSAEVEKYFRIERVWNPQELAELLRPKVDMIRIARRSEARYNYPDFPFDGFLADFNLLQAGVNIESRQSHRAATIPQRDKLKVKPISQSAQSVTAPSTAPESAEAAGLTSAVLTALNFDGHPSVVVPYTAFSEHLASQSALIRLLVPPSIVISKGSELDMSKQTLIVKLEQFASTYLENLPEWTNAGVIHVAHRTIRLLQKLAEKRKTADDTVAWAEEDSMEIDSPYGRRAISCRSLWYRADKADPHIDAVKEWLDRFPQPTADYEAARLLAYHYAAMSEDDRSSIRYALSHLIETGDPALESVRREVGEYCAEIGLAEDDVLDPGKLERLRVTRPNWSCPHLLSLPQSDEVKRLAVLMLAVARFAQHFVRSGGIVLYEAFRVGVENGTLDWEEFRELRNGIDIETFLATVGAKVIGRREDEEEHLTLLPLDTRPIQLRDMARLIDPLPEQVLAADGDFLASRIGVKLRRTQLDPPVGDHTDLLQLVKALLLDEPVALNPRDRSALQQFALDLEFPEVAWPTWLEA